MKKVILGISMIAAVVLSSCGNKKTTTVSESPANSAEATELKGFMLGGMYFYVGFGGVNTVEQSVPDSDDPEAMIKAYRESFILVFKKEQGADIKSLFSGMWEINNKADLEKNLNDLMTSKNNFKAWDYARVVNNASMGYAADYLTEEEVKKYVAETLTLAKADFSDWASYLKNYNEGRLDWDKEDSDKESFDKATSEMLQNPKGLYQYIKL